MKSKDSTVPTLCLRHVREIPPGGFALLDSSSCTKCKSEVSPREFWLRDQYKEYGEHEGPKYVCFNHDDAEGVLIHVREVLPETAPEFPNEACEKEIARLELTSSYAAAGYDEPEAFRNGADWAWNLARETFAPPTTSQIKESAESVEAENLENFEVKPAKYAETAESVGAVWNVATTAPSRVTDTAGNETVNASEKGLINQIQHRDERIAELEARVAELQAICDNRC